MDSDDRFKHLASDPQFKTLRRKQRKIEIDDRFKGMFTDDRFTKYSKDKRGGNRKSSNDLKKFYYIKDEGKEPAKPLKTDDDDEDDEEDEGDERNEENELDEENEVDEENEEDEDAQDEQSISESEQSSSSDESDSELEEMQDAEEGIKRFGYDWQLLDHDAETAEETSKRLAIQNLDWDHLDVRDLYVLLNSVRPPLDIKIYISEFGKERLAREEVEGPKEIVEMQEIDEDEEEYNMLKEKMEAQQNKVNEYEDADEGADFKNEAIRERIRRYQLNKMKYYYAVATFDTIEAAEQVYQEMDGLEFEGSALKLDLRFIPDDVEFDQDDCKAECTKLPDVTAYKAPRFIASALQQTSVRFTWDETDVKRQDKLRRAYTIEELEKDDLDAYLASETDDSAEEEIESGDDADAADRVSVMTGNTEARANKYKRLLESLEDEKNKKKKVDVDVDWTEFDANDDSSHNDVDSSGSVDEDSSREDEESVHSDEEMSDSDADKDNDAPNDENIDDDNDDTDNDSEEEQPSEELDLLVMDRREKQDNFAFNPDDERFRAIYESGLYNIDPSHPSFKRTQAFDSIAERKRQKRQRGTSVAGEASGRARTRAR